MNSQHSIIMAESIKRERFTKVASARVTKVINYLSLLKNCANKNNYEYDQEDVTFMFSELQRALKDSKSAFMHELDKQNSRNGFSFKK